MNGSKKKLSNAVFLEFFRLNGAVIDAIEYFLFMKSIGLDTKLCVYNRFNKMYSPDIEKIHQLIDDRYDLDFEYKDDILFYDKTWNFIKQEFGNVLILDRMTAEIFPLLRANKVVIFHDYSIRFGTEKLYEKMSRYDHIKIFHEMPFAITAGYSTQTKLKMAFNLYKKCKQQKHNYFMNFLSKGRVCDVQNLLGDIPHDEYLFITHKQEDTMKLNDIRDRRLVLWSENPRDFFNKFNTYVYVHDNIYFDPRPRMFHECVFHGKKILYKNSVGIKDGSWYRYNEILSVPDAIEKRTLTSDDTIIREFYD